MPPDPHDPPDTSPEYYDKLFSERVRSVNNSPSEPSKPTSLSGSGKAVGWVVFLGIIVLFRVIGSANRSSQTYDTDYRYKPVEFKMPDLHVPAHQFDPNWNNNAFDPLEPGGDPNLEQPFLTEEERRQREFERILRKVTERKHLPPLRRPIDEEPDEPKEPKANDPPSP